MHSIELIHVQWTQPFIVQDMNNHYSRPRGFVGRRLVYAICFRDTYYGSIVGASATLRLPGRPKNLNINTIIGNVFFHLRRDEFNKYPIRNFGQKVLEAYRNRVEHDWYERYGDIPTRHESLVLMPRSGEIYKRDGWEEVGVTKGEQCKRVGGESTDSWTGRRVWSTDVLLPKRVFARPT